jgi:hypothetical protein
MRLALAILLLAAAPAPIPRGPAVLDRKDWIAACDNTLACTVMALAPDGPGRAYLSLSRGGEPLAAPVLTAVVYTDADRDLEVVRLRARGFEADLPARAEEDELIAQTKDPVVILSFLRLLAGEAKTLVLEADKTAVSLDLSGGQEALGFIDERQGRVGSVTALVRRGPRPAAALAPAPPAPVYTAAPRGSAVEIRPAALPKSLLQRPELKMCEKESLANADARAAWRLGPDLVLWSVPCASSSYNLRSAFFLSDEKGQGARPAPIPPVSPGTEGAQPPSSLLNADFDPKTMVLSAFEKGRALGDCGALARFLWTGRAFEPLEVDYMPECRGVTPEAWPALFRGRER